MLLSPGAALRGTAGQHPLPTPHSQAQQHTIFTEWQQTPSTLGQRGVTKSTGGETDHQGPGPKSASHSTRQLYYHQQRP